MARKRVSDTPAGAVAMFRDARQAAPAAPDGLRADAAIYWASIVSARSPSEWDPVALVLAEMCAHAMADIAQAQKTLGAEGDTYVTGSGILKLHPGVTLQDSATRRMLALLRALGLSASDPRDAAQRDGSYRRAVRVVADLADDDLLAH